jgi:redox-sensing transcriptional repressor
MGLQLTSVPGATVARLPLYHRVLLELHGAGTATVSSEELAARAGVNAAKVRKDLSHLGSYGTRGVGYDVDLLLAEVTRRLGVADEQPVAIIGLGNLGRALANHGGFAERGFPVAALFDTDTQVVGQEVAGLVVESLGALEERIAALGVTIAVITTPPGSAQRLADRVVKAGVRSILNFAPCVLTVPDDVSVRQVDLTLELQVLSYYQLGRPLLG